MQAENKTCKLYGDFPALSSTRCRYLMTNRNGGKGKGIFSSNNMSLDVGDDLEVVMANRLQLKKQLSLSALLTAHQVHGTEVFCLTKETEKDLVVDAYDALVTDIAGVGLMIQQADCQAVLLFDPIQEVIAAVHCGWRGSVQNILAKTVAVMTEKYGTNPSDLHGKISPSLGPCCAEFVNYRDELPDHVINYMTEPNYFDFWRLSKEQLCSAGLYHKNIEVAGICTRCSKEYFSYRMACLESDGITGRNSSLIYLRNSVC